MSDPHRIERKRLEEQWLRLENRRIEEDSYAKRAVTTNQYAIEAIKIVFLANGAAAIALLTLAGNGVGELDKKTVAMLLDSATQFGLGVSGAAGALTLAYYSRVSNRRPARKGPLAWTIEISAGVLGVGALVIFPLTIYMLAGQVLR